MRDTENQCNEKHLDGGRIKTRQRRAFLARVVEERNRDLFKLDGPMTDTDGSQLEEAGLDTEEMYGFINEEGSSGEFLEDFEGIAIMQ